MPVRTYRRGDDVRVMAWTPKVDGARLTLPAPVTRLAEAARVASVSSPPVCTSCGKPTDGIDTRDGSLLCWCPVPDYEFTLLGNPATKKNSRRWGRNGRGHRVLLPSKAFETWLSSVGHHVNRAWRGRPPLTGPVEVRALFYRRRDVGDLDNYCAAVGDLLQTCRVLANDRQIKSWDGSRLFIDRARPRVQVTIRELAE